MSKAAEWLRTLGHTKAKPSNIAHSCNNVGKIAYGFTWAYIDK